MPPAVSHAAHRGALAGYQASGRSLRRAEIYHRGTAAWLIYPPGTKAPERQRMPETNPMAVIADCIEKAKATADQDLIGDYIAEALGTLQIDNTEDDAFHMLGSAIIDAVADDEEHTAGLLEIWTGLEEQRRLS
jgi:hypothetical protein